MKPAKHQSNLKYLSTYLTVNAQSTLWYGMMRADIFYFFQSESNIIYCKHIPIITCSIRLDI